ncbi:hypothetical protein LCGC14_0312940 [marine sediment metagenome]|uniref:Uncharacterized protein n=1 Tax=marine sediment metagenome TaxID=412755 RepID=A0A0F9U3Z0_9ZZZZ
MHHPGDCPICGLLCRLRRDGTVGRHYPATARWRYTPNGGMTHDSDPCNGEGQKPTPHVGSSAVAKASHLLQETP